MKLNNCIIGKIIIYFCLIFIVDNTFVYAGEKVNLNARYEIVDVSFGDCRGGCPDCNEIKKMLVGKLIVFKHDKFINTNIFKGQLNEDVVDMPIYLRYDMTNYKNWPEEIWQFYDKDFSNLYIVFDEFSNIIGIFYDLENANALGIGGCFYKLKKLND